METKNSSTATNIFEKLGKKLKNAQQEIDELSLQFSLGKAEASDKFEEIKKDFNAKVHKWKLVFANVKSDNKEKVALLKSKLEELQVQLALGKAEAKDVFQEQRKNILKVIHEIQTEIKNNKKLHEFNDEFNSEMEVFKLKMEILLLKFELKKFEVRDEFNDAMKDAKINIDKLSGKIEEKWDTVKKKYSNVGNEIDQAVDYLKNAVNKLKDKIL